MILSPKNNIVKYSGIIITFYGTKIIFLKLTIYFYITFYDKNAIYTLSFWRVILALQYWYNWIDSSAVEMYKGFRF